MIALVTDSTCDLPAEIIEKYSIEIVPLTVHFKDDTYYDKIDLENEEFFSMMESAEELPTTSQPSVGLFIDKYQDLADKYEVGFAVDEIFGLKNTGIVTKRDNLCIQDSPKIMWQVVQDL